MADNTLKCTSGRTVTELREYVERHNIPLLFKLLTSTLVYFRPPDPKQFILDELWRIKRGKAEDSYWDEEEVETLFKMFDVTNTGVLTPNQFVQAMKSLGYSDVSPVTASITLQQFKILAKEQLRKMLARLGKAS